MDQDLIDKHGVGLSGRAIIQNFEIKPTDGTTLFVYLGKSGKFQIPYSREQKHVSISDIPMLLIEINSISNMGRQK